MTDRRDDRELEPLVEELAATLSALQEEVDSGPARSPPLRPPSFREVLRFTERQTIPTLVAILEANIRMLELAGAAMRAMDPERAVDEGATAHRALEGGRVSTERLAAGLSDLRSALAGAEATNPEARELLAEADRLSAEIRERLEEPDTEGRASGTDTPAEGVSIEVEDASEVNGEGGSSAPEPDIDAELDSIRDEVRGEAEERENGNDEPDENPTE